MITTKMQVVLENAYSSFRKILGRLNGEEQELQFDIKCNPAVKTGYFQVATPNGSRDYIFTGTIMRTGKDDVSFKSTVGRNASIRIKINNLTPTMKIKVKLPATEKTWTYTGLRFPFTNVFIESFRRQQFDIEIN